MAAFFRSLVKLKVSIYFVSLLNESFLPEVDFPNLRSLDMACTDISSAQQQ